MLLESPHKLSKFSFRKRSVGFIIVCTFVIKIGNFGKKLLACLAKLQFTLSNVQIEEKFAVGRKPNLLDFGRCPSGLESILFKPLAKNSRQLSEKCNLQRHRNNMRAWNFEQKPFVFWFFRTPGKISSLWKKHIFVGLEKLHSTSLDEHFELKDNIGKKIFNFQKLQMLRGKLRVYDKKLKACLSELRLKCLDERVEEKFPWEDINLFIPIWAHFVWHLIFVFPDFGKKNGRVVKTVFYVSRVTVYRIFSDTFQEFTNFSEFHRNTFFLRKNTSETLSELHSKGLHKLSELSCLWNKSITSQLLMESQWEPSDFCTESFDCATNTAFYVNRKTIWGNYFSEEISRFWRVLDIREQKRTFWRKDISMFHKSTFLRVLQAQMNTLRRTFLLKKFFCSSVGAVHLVLYQNFWNFWQKILSVFSKLHSSKAEDQIERMKLLKVTYWFQTFLGHWQKISK